MISVFRDTSLQGTDIYLSGEDPRFCKRGIGQYPARLSGGFQSPTEINASGGSQPRKKEGASHHARRGKNAEAFLNLGKQWMTGMAKLSIFCC